MKNLFAFAAFLALLLLVTACSKPYYQTKNFKKKTKTHTTMAILPAHMLITGFQGLDADKKDIIKQQEAESKAFQLSLQSELLKSTKNGKKAFQVEIQPINRTNKMLLESDLTITESWDEDPEALAKLLGVDAVLVTRVEKMRYFSDLASYGIDVALKLISAITKNILPILAGKNAKKSNDIYSNWNLIEANSGNVLWSLSDQREANWNNPANETIDAMNGYMAKHFPYRR